MEIPSSASSVALDSSPAHNVVRRTLRRVMLATAALALLVMCWRFAEVRPEVVFRTATMSALWRFLTGLFPPDVSPDFLRTVGQALIQTIAMAVAGTLLSVAVALPLGILATSTLWNRGVLVAAVGPSLWFWLGAGASRMTRALLGFVRAVPDLVWALLFVAAVGLGPLPGTLALALAYSGVLGRVYGDVFDHVQPQPLEALQSTGATRLQVFLCGVWPQALPHLTAYTLYSFECCVRAAAVLGFVGAGGIGYEINISMRLFEYGQVLTLLIVFIMLLVGTDAASRYLRMQGTKGRPIRNWVRAERVQVENVQDGHGATARAFLSSRSRRILLWTLLVIVCVTSFAIAGFTPQALADAGITARVAGFARRMLPPDLSREFLGSLGVPLLQTIAISVMGTLAGVVLAVVLAIPATSTLMLVNRDSPGRHTLIDRLVHWLFFGSARLVLNILRSIPELVWVLILILAVGIGPFAGTIALGLHTAGVLGKLYAETMEEVSRRPVEALHSVGAGSLQVLVWAIWPQARPMLSSYTILRWETNLRASTILGLVGGGGLGQAVYNNVQLGFYSRLSTLILLIYALVLASDWVSERVRVGVA